MGPCHNPGLTYTLGRVAVRIEKRQTAAVLHVLPDRGLQQRAFACSRLSDDIDMAPTVALIDAKKVARLCGSPCGQRR